MQQHLPSPLMAPSKVEVLISRVMHYKKMEMMCYEVITKKHFFAQRQCYSTDSRIS